MAIVPDFDVLQYIGTDAFIEPLFMRRAKETDRRRKRSDVWKYFGFLKQGDHYPGGKKCVFCDVCWKQGVSLAYPYPLTATNVGNFHLRDKHNVVTKHYTRNCSNANKRVAVNSSNANKKTRIPEFSSGEEEALALKNDNEEELTNNIVEFLRENKLPAETIENESFQKILKCAGIGNIDNEKGKTRRSRNKQSSEDEVSDDETSIKQEYEDTTVNEVWLDAKHEGNFESESASSDAPLRRSNLRSAKAPINKRNGSHKSDKAEEALSKFLIAKSIPFNLIDTKMFINFVRELNPQYRVPKSSDLKEKVLQKLSSSSVWGP